jgi:uncharacterized membrane protein
MSRSIQVTRHFAGPVEAVFDLCADLEHAAANVTAIARVEMLTDGPVGVGTRWRETRVMLGREATEELEVTAVDPGRSYRVEAGSRGMRYVSDLTFADAGAEGTRVRMTFDGTPTTLAARLLTPLALLMKRPTQRMLAQDVEDMRRSLEGETPAH